MSAMRVGFSPVTAQILNLEQAFALARQAGLDLVELSYDAHEALPQIQAVDTVKALVGETGLALSVHLSYLDLNLAALSPSARRSGIERTVEGMRYADEVGAEVGVLHTGKVPYENPMIRAAARDNLASSLAQILEETSGMRCRLALENLAFPDDLLRTVDDLDETCRAFDLGITLDFGHAMIQSPAVGPAEADRGRPGGLETIRAYLDRFTGRIWHLHIHSNHGSNDDHLPIDEGVIDYYRYADFLKEFDGPACMEIAGSGVDGVKRSARQIREILGRPPVRDEG